MTPAGIEPATFRFVARHLNHCATAVPIYIIGVIKLKEIRYAGHVEDMSVTRNGCYILFKDLPVWEPKRISVDKRKVLKRVFVRELTRNVV